MKKGSASGYDAETGEESAGSESSLEEPYECPSLYRIRRSQENHQFLRQDRRGRDRGRRQCAGKKLGNGETRGPTGLSPFYFRMQNLEFRSPLTPTHSAPKQLNLN